MAENHAAPVTGDQNAVFRNVAQNLYRHAATGIYYALLKRGGKQFRRSLKTTDRALANRRLGDLRKQVENLSLSEDSRAAFDEVAHLWLDSVKHTMKLASITRRETCINNLIPFFKGVTIRNITANRCDHWLTSRGPNISASTFAHELGTMKLIFEFAVERGLLLANPARHIARRRIPQPQIQVLTREQFQRLIAAIRDAAGTFGTQGKGKDGADLVELLAYSGCRLREATALRWTDVDFDRNSITVTGGETGTKNSESRTAPMAPALRDLLLRMREARNPLPEDPISLINDAKKCLDTACRKLGFPHFTHHDFRHFFATTCIESGVDIPTISRWLGHKDGGALAMKVYGHLRQEHSFAMIKRVSFGNEQKSEDAIPKTEKVS
ncbi:MAG: tyrosine-type recombinase/integrase [Limisphaerales bacterium]